MLLGGLLVLFRWRLFRLLEVLLALFSRRVVWRLMFLGRIMLVFRCFAVRCVVVLLLSILLVMWVGWCRLLRLLSLLVRLVVLLLLSRLLLLLVLVRLVLR